MKNKLKKVLEFIVNPRLLVCFGLAWMITNGWSYILLGLGTYYDIGWMAAVAGTYLTVLWFPFSPEKIITFGISIGLLKWIFPNDRKTLGALEKLLADAKAAWRKRKQQRREKKSYKNSV